MCISVSVVTLTVGSANGVHFIITFVYVMLAYVLCGAMRKERTGAVNDALGPRGISRKAITSYKLRDPPQSDSVVMGHAG